MLKFADNPPQLPAGSTSVHDLSGDWFVAHTKARAEKAFAWDLQDRGIGYYLPMVPRITISSGKKRRIIVPVFPSYVFFCGSPAARHEALTTNRLCQVIPVVDQPKLVEELGSIERALAGDLKIDFHPHAAVGRRCRVRAGPLVGLVGTVIRRDHVTRLVLHVSMLGQGAAVEIDADLLEPADD